MKNQNSLISIIVPVFNVEEYLPKCINSIEQQSYANIEILLVDDGSNDNSSNICDKAARGDRRIRVFHKQNGGLSDARNFGLAQAKGDFAVFVDSDDYLGENHIENLANALTSTDADIAVTGCTRVGVKEKVFATSKKPTISLIDGKEAILTSIVSGGKFESHAWGKIYPRRYFEYLNYPIGKKFEDQYVTYKIFANAQRIAYTDSNDYYYLTNRPGSISNSSAIGLLDHYEAYCQMETYIKDKIPSISEQISAKRYESIAAVYLSFARENNEDMCKTMQEKMRKEQSKALTAKYLGFNFKLFYLLSSTSEKIMFNAAKALSRMHR